MRMRFVRLCVISIVMFFWRDGIIMAGIWIVLRPRLVVRFIILVVTL